MFAEISQIKQRLALAMGAQMDHYWSDFKKFTHDQISKAEWDSNAQKHLGLNVALHNEFVLAIFRSADASGPEPVRRPVLAMARGNGTPVTAPTDKMHKKKSGKCEMPFDTYMSHQYSRPNMDNALLAQISSLDRQAKWDAHARDLPGILQIRARMYIAACDYGLQGVTAEAAELVLRAMEIHIKNIMEESMAVSREHVVEGPIRRGFAATLVPDKNGQQIVAPIVPLHVATAVTLRPQLLGSHLKTTREKISAAL